MSDLDRGLLPALDRLRARGRVIGLACAIAVALTLVGSLLLPRKYTAIARIVIEPPAGGDSRVSTAVSPIYLESLRSYELFASSDNLFLQAVQKFGLRQGSEPIDRLKKDVLKAEMPRNTKILEIRATLRDPKTAHAVALYIAEETVKLNRDVSREADQELTGEAEKQAAEARSRMEKSEQAWARSVGERPVEQLKADLQSDEILKAALKRGLAESEVLADTDRANGYRKQLESLQQKITSARKLFAERSATLDQLQAERTAARTMLSAAETRLQEARSALGYRGERLRVIDPGIVPERPSSPNIPLNVGIALLAALVLSALYITLELSYRAQRAESTRRSFRVAGRHD